LLVLGLALPLAASCTKVDPAGGAGSADSAKVKELEDRLAKVEATTKEFDTFLRPIMAQMEQQKKQQQDSEPDPNAVFAVDVAGSPVDGPKDGAFVTIVEGFDFRCPYCMQVSPTLDDVVKEYNGKVRVVYKNFVVHPPALKVHLASCAANKQGKYVEFKKAWWDQGFGKYASTRDESFVSDDNLMKIVAGLKFDMKKFKADMDSPDCKQWVDADQAELTKFGVRGTPALFVNGKMLPGAVPKEQLKQLIDQQLKVAEASGVPAKDYYQKEIFDKGEKKFKSKAE
jgi:protein-disulfide isomerase